MSGSRIRAMPRRIWNSSAEQLEEVAGMKKILASMRIALRALKVNRMRSALTMLGIIIGVAAVIAMVAVGSGATAADPGADPEHRQQPDHRAAGQRQHATACGWAPARRRR